MAPNTPTGSNRIGRRTVHRNMNESEPLTRYIILSMIGRSIECPNRTAEKLKSLVQDIQSENDQFFSGVCQQLQLTSDSAQPTFNFLADQLFEDSVNWGRIVSFYAFSVKVAEHFQHHGAPHMVDNVINWTAEYIHQLRWWIERDGGGWDGFYQNFNPQCNGTRKLLWKGFLVTATTLGLGAFVAIACRT